MMWWMCSGLLAAAAACRGGQPRNPVGSAGLATVVDSTADSVVARVDGAVPATAIRLLTEELRIAPAADDTSLFTEISEFEVDPRGRMWVFDRPSSSIFLFDAEGKLVRRIGRQGGGPGEFEQSGGMVSLGDTGIAIWDPANARISFFDSTGVFRTSWNTPSGFSTDDGVITDRQGDIFLRRPVTAAREGEILGRMGLVRLKQGGAFGDSLAPPDLQVPRESYVAVRKSGSDRFASSMTSSFAPNYYWGWHRDGYFVVADGGKGYLVLTRKDLKPLVIRRTSPPVAIAAAEREEERARITYSMRQTEPGWSWSGPAIPETKSPILALFIPGDGRIWVRIPVASEVIPTEDLPVRRDTLAPVMHYRTPVAYEVYAPGGHFLGRVDFPPRTRLIDARDNFVWAIGQDENDLPAVVRFRVTPGWP